MCALEFSKDHSVGVQERPVDNELLPLLIPELPRVNAKTKERPFCAVYATKARILMHAHLSRMELSTEHVFGTWCSGSIRTYILESCKQFVCRSSISCGKQLFT